VQAILLEEFGDPKGLRLREVPKAGPTGDQVMVEVRAAAVNHSDVKNAQGAMAHTTLPRVPGRDFAGVVVDGPRDLVGTEVWGTGGDLGFTVDGSHARYLVVPRSAVRPKPANLSMEEAAAVGVGFVTAYSALVGLGGLTAGEAVLLTGAAGAVGSAAAQIARWKGARVIGAVRDASQRAVAEEAGATTIIDTSREDLPAAVLAATDGKGADLALDTVGGPLFEPSLDALGPEGRLIVITTTAERRVAFDLLDFYRKDLRLFGLNTLRMDAEACARILNQLSPGFEEGALHPPLIAERHPLEEAATAYERLMSGEARGKVLLVMDQASQ
jgi:NADPH:quinone reductase-like Zn-dependent oxidoreductase